MFGKRRTNIYVVEYNLVESEISDAREEKGVVGVMSLSKLKAQV